MTFYSELDLEADQTLHLDLDLEAAQKLLTRRIGGFVLDPFLKGNVPVPCTVPGTR